MSTSEQYVLTLRTVLYSRSHIQSVVTPGKLCTTKTTVFPFNHLIRTLSKPTKTAARKLSNCIFVRYLPPELNIQTKNKTPGIALKKGNAILMDFSHKEPGAEAENIKSIKTRLPRHLLGSIDVCFRILQKSKTFHIIAKMNLHCPLPDVGSKFDGEEIVKCRNYDAYLRELLSQHSSSSQVCNYKVKVKYS